MKQAITKKNTNSSLLLAFDDALYFLSTWVRTFKNKFKRLLYIISQQVPFVPNISNIGQAIEATRKQTYEMISTLERRFC